MGGIEKGGIDEGGIEVSIVGGCVALLFGAAVVVTSAPWALAMKMWLHLLQRTRIGPWASLSSPTLKRVWHFSQVMIKVWALAAASV